MKLFILIDTYEYGNEKQTYARVTDSKEAAEKLKRLLETTPRNRMNGYYNRKEVIREVELLTLDDVNNMLKDPWWDGSVD